eukprot:10153069-Lingulodinium_polyedra.AAC.1
METGIVRHGSLEKSRRNWKIGNNGVSADPWCRGNRKIGKVWKVGITVLRPPNGVGEVGKSENWK